MALAFVQGVVKNATATPAAFPAFGTAVAVGDLIVVLAGGDGGVTGTVVSVTDSLGNTYTQVPSFDFANAGGTLNMDAWYSVVTHAGSSNVVTVAFHDTLENFNGVVQHFNGFTATATLDKRSTSSNASSTTCTSGATATTTNANEIVIGMGIHASTTSAFSLGTGYTNLTQSNVSARATAMESKIVSATGAQTATFSIAAARVNMGGVLTFYDGAGGGGGGSTGEVKAYVSGAFTAKPIKVWNGSAWVTKPMKFWNGSTWTTTSY